MKFVIEHALQAACVAAFLYFAYSLIRFALIGHKNEGWKTKVLTISAFLAVIASMSLWFWALRRFVDDPNWYFKERLVTGVGVTLCLIAIALSRFASRQTSIAIIAGALLVALNWIGNVIPD